MKLKQILLLILLLISTCFLCFELVAQPTTTGMLAYFKMNGNLNNTGPAAITASAIGTSYTTNNANVANNAVQFAGTTSSYLDFTDDGSCDFSGTNNFTISLSFFFNGTSTGGLLDNCLNYGGWGIWFWQQVAGTWNIQFNYKNLSVGSPAATAFTINQWHQVAAVRNNGTISVYIDGVFRLSGPEGTTSPAYPLHMIAGAFAYSGYTPPRYNPLLGKMDEIRIYNRALTAGEIAILAPFSLPLQLGDFSAVRKSNSIQLNWETFSEKNSLAFDIERSADGSNFQPIGRVSSHGTSDVRQTYFYNDLQPLPATGFYRLKLIDVDGSFTYSKVVAVKNTAVISFQVFPNPATDHIQLQIPTVKDGQATIRLVDAAGKMLSALPVTLKSGNNAFNIPLYTYPKGIYYISLTAEDTQQAIRFIKQ